MDFNVYYAWYEFWESTGQKIILILHRYLARGGIVLAIIVFLIYLYSVKRGRESREE